MAIQQMFLGAGGKSGPPVDEVFSTDLYTGTAVAHDIDNGIDLLNEGGMIWTKVRSGGGTYRWQVWTTARTRSKYMFLGSTDSTDAESNISSSTGGITSFNSDGFSFGNEVFHENVNGKPSVAFTFRKAEKFFDVVEYDGTNGSQSVAHNLGCVPGFMIVRRYNSAGSGWITYHSGRTGGAATKMQKLNESGSQEGGMWNDTAPTSTHFTVGGNAEVNDGGGGYKYLCYLFAEDEDNIKCGYYDSTGATGGNAINVGFEPQWLLVKAADQAGGWSVIDTARGLTEQLNVDSNAAAGSVDTGNIVFTSTGFTLNTAGWINGDDGYGNSVRYIYVAIKKEG